MDNKKQDFSISGKGVLGSGEYGNLRFSGSGKINGDLTCVSLSVSGSLVCDGNLDCEENIKCSGSFSCKGNIRTKLLDSSGSHHIDGSLQAEHLECSGSVKVAGDFTGGSVNTSGTFKIGGSMKMKSLDSSGSVRVEKSVEAEIIETHGSFRIGGDCEAERIYSSGKLDVDGLLNAGEIKIKLIKAESRVGEIGGERIEVKRAPHSGLFNFPLIRGTLVTASIEGDDIYLENTNAGIVRGARIHIGAGCEIETVEYTESYQKADDAVVKNLINAGDGSVL
jgi:cytoskeletal protein CcmA (bactofilin family)